MKFQGMVVAAGLSAWMAGMAATVEPGATPAAAVAKPLEGLIEELADQQFKVREQASLELWKIGDPAVAALKVAAAGGEPERAYRAREILRKIELFISPETDPEVIKLVESYTTANPAEKANLFGRLNRRRAWRQILKLFAGETNPDLQMRLQQQLRENNGFVYGISGVAVVAARECLIRGDAAGARDYLELAPADSHGMMALADFHRSQGTLPEEMEKAKTLSNPKAAGWLLALYRASGELQSASKAAEAAGETQIAAITAMLLGDPEPWLSGKSEPGEGNPTRAPKIYTDLALKRWRGATLRAADLEGVIKSAASRNPSDRNTGVNWLFLLGEARAGEDAYFKTSPRDAFIYLDSMERIPEALAALGLEGESPDYAAWINERLERVLKIDEEDDEDSSKDLLDLLTLSNFFERRGLHSKGIELFVKPMLKLADKDDRKFLKVLGALFSNMKGGMTSGAGSPRLAAEITAEWAGENADRWEDAVNAALGEADGAVSLWDWTLELDPKASRSGRLDALLALSGNVPDSDGLRQRWLDLIWAQIDQTPMEKRQPLVSKLLMFTNAMPDLEILTKAAEVLPQVEGKKDFGDGIRQQYASALMLKEGVSGELDRIGYGAKLKENPDPSWHAYAATLLRKDGRAEEAAAEDVWVDKLALGRDAFKICGYYMSGNEFSKANEWLERSILQAEGTEQSVPILATYGQNLLNAGNWKVAAAVFEVIAAQCASDSMPFYPAKSLSYRIQADMSRALSNLDKDRAGSIAILRKCHGMSPIDGSLADYFFPSLRKAGLMQEHAEWFKLTWDGITKVLNQYPQAEVTCNTAGWLAAKAASNLDEAAEIEMRALALNPQEPNYLDTMAEIEFSKGNRDKALEWSAKAINFASLLELELFRRQYEHFRADPFPR